MKNKKIERNESSFRPDICNIRQRKTATTEKTHRNDSDSSSIRVQYPAYGSRFRTSALENLTVFTSNRTTGGQLLLDNFHRRPFTVQPSFPIILCGGVLLSFIFSRKILQGKNFALYLQSETATEPNA